MSEHALDIRQAPGWWSNLVRAECSCGWCGPTRDLYQDRGHFLVHRDGPKHLDESGDDR